MVVYKKRKRHKKFVLKKTLKFGLHKNRLEAAQIENKINYLEENRTKVDSIKKIMKNSSGTIN